MVARRLAATGHNAAAGLAAMAADLRKGAAAAPAARLLEPASLAQLSHLLARVRHMRSDSERRAIQALPPSSLQQQQRASQALQPINSGCTQAAALSPADVERLWAQFGELPGAAGVQKQQAPAVNVEALWAQFEGLGQ